MSEQGRKSTDLINLSDLFGVNKESSFIIYHNDQEIPKSSQFSKNPIYKNNHAGREQLVYNTNDMLHNRMYDVELDGERLSVMIDNDKKIHIWIKDD